MPVLLLPLLIPVGIAALAVVIIEEFIKTDTHMANSHNLFENYNTEISVPTSKKNKLKASKDALRDRIRKHFAEKHPKYEPYFFIQGSYKMGTMIRTKDDICDLDDGVYFFREADVTGTTLQGWVWDAVDGHTTTPPQHRKKCVRNIFTNDYEIDMPVYCQKEGEPFKLAIKDEAFRIDDPRAMVDWFNDEKDTNGCLVRIVKYLKAWCNNVNGTMPSGLAMTILATNAKRKFIYTTDRDDINLKDTLKEIKKALDWSFECVVPAEPKDNLFKDYDEVRKKKFKDALSAFLTDAEAALREENQLAASKLWRKHLGDRFPLGEDKTTDNTRKNSLIASIGSASPYGRK